MHKKLFDQQSHFPYKHQMVTCECMHLESVVRNGLRWGIFLPINTGEGKTYFYYYYLFLRIFGPQKIAQS